MIQRNVARRFKLSVALLASTVFLTQQAFAQSWGQLKDAAVDASAKKDFAGAEQNWKKSLEVSGASGPRYVQSLSGLAKLYVESEKGEQALELYKKIESAANASSLSDDERAALSDYAQLLKQKGSAEQASELEKRFSLQAKVSSPAAATSPAASSTISAVAADQKANVDKDQESWTNLYKSAADAATQKNYGQAEKQLKEALAIADKYGDSSPMTSSTLAKLEDICAAQGKNAEGESYSMRKLAAVRTRKGPMTKEFAQALMAHAGWLRKLNRKAEAISEEGKAESILAHISPKQTTAGNTSPAGPAAVDASGTRQGNIYSRVKAVQGLGGMINNMINQPDN